jgi:hypothetical protein
MARLVRLPFVIAVFVTALSAGCNNAAGPQPPKQPSSQMATKFRLPRGIQVADLSGIHEAYSVTVAQDGYHVFTVNVSAENIHRVFCRLAAEVNEPAFLLLETGTHRDIEQQLRKSPTDPLHKDVYYLDGLPWGNAKSIVDTYSELLTHDGMINFGFGSRDGHDEVFVGPYKIFTIYADKPARYELILNELGMTKVDRIKTIWDNITEHAPGQRLALTDAKPTIWDMIDELKEKGLYLAERRED